MHTFCVRTSLGALNRFALIIVALLAVTSVCRAEERSARIPKNRTIELVRIPAGSIVIGASFDGKWVPSFTEQPKHEVEITKDFYLAKTELTQEQWLAIMGTWPGQPPNTEMGVGPKLAAYNISWNDCHALIDKLNAMGRGRFRLPTEAEWEYACRGPASNPNRYARFPFGDSDCYPQPPIPCNLSDYAWWLFNSQSQVHSVAELNPTPFGLYDMLGNVWEWCEDDWHPNYDSDMRPDDGSAWVGDPPSKRKVAGGGYYHSPPLACRSAARNEALDRSA